MIIVVIVLLEVKKRLHIKVNINGLLTLDVAILLRRSNHNLYKVSNIMIEEE